MYYFFYKNIMKLAHKFNWHYMKPSHIEGDTMLWCHWCGIRVIVKRERVKIINNNMD